MKITLVSADRTWHTEQLEQSAQKYGVELDITNISNLNTIHELKETLGDVIIWRSGSLDISYGRTTFLSLVKDKPIINYGILVNPFVTHKLFQQKLAEQQKHLNSIPTYHFKKKSELLDAIDNGILKFPFIQKPNLGARGMNVTLIKSKEDLDNQDIKIKDFVYQNFIRNTGDYRAFVLGGKVLGVIKRVAKDGTFLNNISQGGSAHLVTDEKIYNAVANIGLSISSLFQLTMCGVDVIFDEDTKELRFLEVNTVPQWQGFQSATNINVADKIIELCLGFGKKGNTNLKENIDEYFSQNIHFLNSYTKFHYFNRRWLWEGKQEYKDELDKLQEQFIGKNEEQTRAIIRRKARTDIPDEDRITYSKKNRSIFLKKYPKLLAYNQVLYAYLTAEKIYNYSIRAIVQEYINDNDLTTLRNALLNDKEAILELATAAVNFFYLLENYNPDIQIDPEVLYQLAKDTYANEKTQNRLRAIMYILTHSIIGETRFYSEQLIKNKAVFAKIIELLEDIIEENYFSLSLDNKFEFLVCAKLCSYETRLKDLINSEAERSLSKLGNYLTDTLNDRIRTTGDNMRVAEHRNVLYLMAMTEPNFMK